MLLVGPWLIKRFLEGRVRARALVWTYFAALLSAAAATVLLLGSFFLHYLPHDYLDKVHLVCKTVAGCPRALPVWANMASSFLLGGTLVGLALFAVVALWSQLSCSGEHQAALEPGWCGATHVPIDAFVCRGVGDRRPGPCLVHHRLLPPARGRLDRAFRAA